MTAPQRRVNERLDQAQLDTLFLHILRCPEVMAAAMGKVTPSYFQSEDDAAYGVVWEAASDFRKEHGRLIPSNYLVEDVDRRLARLYGDRRNDLPLVPDLLRLTSRVYGAEDDEIIPSVGLGLLQAFLWERNAGTKLASLKNAKSITQSMWDEILQAAQSSEVAAAVSANPFETFSLNIEPRDPIGVRFLDEMMGGGPRRTGKVYGMLAFSGGGGKTTLANQVAISYAMKGRRVAFFSYEENPADDEYRLPIYACAYDLPRGVLENVRSMGDVDAETAQRIRERQARLTNIRYFNMSGINTRAGSGGTAEVDSALGEFCNEHGGVDLMVIDWFWPMVQAYYSQLQVDKGKRTADYQVALEMTHGIKQLAGKYRCWAWVAHNLEHAAATGGKKKLSFENAMGLKAFAQYMDGCFLLDKLDEHDIGEIHSSKFRAGKARTTKHIQLKGEFAKFVEVDHDLVYDKRAKSYVDPQTIRQLPTEDGREGLSASG